MTAEQADEILGEIEELAFQIERDDELAKEDPRYRIIAKWIDLDIDNASV